MSGSVDSEGTREGNRSENARFCTVNIEKSI